MPVLILAFRLMAYIVLNKVNLLSSSLRGSGIKNIMATQRNGFEGGENKRCSWVRGRLVVASVCIVMISSCVLVLDTGMDLHSKTLLLYCGRACGDGACEVGPSQMESWLRVGGGPLVESGARLQDPIEAFKSSPWSRDSPEDITAVDESLYVTAALWGLSSVHTIVASLFGISSKFTQLVEIYVKFK